MAAAQSQSRRLDELLMCPVCLDTFREARTLNCLHTFCTECLEGCRRVLRREIECPVCKRVSLLPAAGVRGLPMDYRIEQIRDYISGVRLGEEMSPHGEHGPVNGTGAANCDVCKAQQRTTTASRRCLQCLMQFCESCADRHNTNPVLAAHKMFSLGDTNAASVLFCVSHLDQPIRYFCCQCRVTLCTICAIQHDPTHKHESLEYGIIDKYRSRLTDSLSLLTTRLSDVKTRVKRVSALRQSRQSSLYAVQRSIQDHTAQIIKAVQQRESRLLADAQSRFDFGQTVDGSNDSVAELEFRKTSIEKLIGDVRSVLTGPPHACLVSFDEINGRINALTETIPPAANVPRQHAQKSIRFIPASFVDILIGSLQECNVSDDTYGSEEFDNSPSTTSSPSRSSATTPRKRNASILNAVSPARKCDARMARMKVINRVNLNSMWRESPESSARSGVVWRESPESSTSSGADSSVLAGNSPTASTPGILGVGMDSSDDDVISSSARQPTTSPLASIAPFLMTSASSAASPTAQFQMTSSNSVVPATPRSPSIIVTSSLATAGQQIGMTSSTPVSTSSIRVSSTLEGNNTQFLMTSLTLPVTPRNPRLVFRVDKVGGLQGMIQCPVSVVFVANGNLAVAESDRRVQIFDQTGRSVSVIGWGSNVKPLCVSVGGDNMLAVADKTLQTIRFFPADGHYVSATFPPRRWPDRMFGQPVGVAVVKATGQVVVADSDQRRVSIHSSDGALLTSIERELTGNPTHVAVDNHGNVYTSDSASGCIKVFDGSNGEMIRQFRLPTVVPPVSTSGSPGSASSTSTPHMLSMCHRPYGLCFDPAGRVAVCDRDSHRVVLFSADGRVLSDLLTEKDGLRYPCNIAITDGPVGGARGGARGGANMLVAIVESYNGFISNEPHHALKLYAF